MIRRAVFAAFSIMAPFGMSARAAESAASHPAASDPVRESLPGTIRRLDLQIGLPRVGGDEIDTWNWNFDPPRWLYWAAAVLFALILLYILRDLIPGWRARGDDGWADGAVGASAGPLSPEANLADADYLAGQGRFVEAMHLLLLHSLGEIRRRLNLEFSDSMTSREIVRRASLPEAGTAALRGIVTRVELSYFGDHPAERPDYDACRARYEELTHILVRSPA